MPLDSVQLPGPVTYYTGNYVSLPAAMLKPPVEGNRSVPVSINWLAAGIAPGYTIAFDATSQRVVPISQIAALYIDNTTNVSNVVIYFPDTNFEIIAPSESSGFYPVVTNQLRFFAFCQTVPTAQDRTFIQVLNFLPPALALATGPAGGTSVGTVTEIATVSPVLGGPITTQGTISLDENALLSVIETYPDVHLGGTFEVNGVVTLAGPTAIHGTTTNDNAPAGYVGEYLSEITPLASEVNISAGSGDNVCALALSAGDWDVWGELWVDTATGSGVWTGRTYASVTTVSATLPVGPSDTVARAAYQLTGLQPGATGEFSVPTGVARISLAVATTVYLVGWAGTTTSGVVYGWGALKARRVR
jgi:hypothetical protein